LDRSHSLKRPAGGTPHSEPSHLYRADRNTQLAGNSR
jgi:hypothetical protein